MIHTIIIFTCTIINSAWGFFWIRQLNKQYKDSKRKRHQMLCLRCITVGSCPHCHRDSDKAYNYCPNCGAEMEER